MPYCRGEATHRRNGQVALTAAKLHWATILPPLPQKLRFSGAPIGGVLVAVILTTGAPSKGCPCCRGEATLRRNGQVALTAAMQHWATFLLFPKN